MGGSSLLQGSPDLPQPHPGCAEPTCPPTFILLIFLAAIRATPEGAMATGPAGLAGEELQGSEQSPGRVGLRDTAGSGQDGHGGGSAGVWGAVPCWVARTALEWLQRAGHRPGGAVGVHGDAGTQSGGSCSPAVLSPWAGTDGGDKNRDPKRMAEMSSASFGPRWQSQHSQAVGQLSVHYSFLKL